MMKLTACLLLFAGAAAHDFSTCATDKLSLATIDLTPDPPVKGQDLKVTMTGKPTVAVSGGTAHLTVKAFGITIATKDFDLCKDMGVTCPQPAGSAFSGSLTYTIPSAAPAGVTADCQVDVTDPAGNKLGCYTLKVKIGSGAARSFLRVGEGSYVAQRPREEIEFLFESWRREFGVQFKDAAETMERMEVFAQNLNTIEAHNAEAATHGWEMGTNEFMHLTWAEFRQTKLGFGGPRKIPELTLIPRMTQEATPEEVMAAPDSVDWADKGAVTAIKNQQQCGSCWAFSTTGSMEGAYFLKTGSLKSFSEQELVDCDTVDQGCNGGLMDNAFGWLKKNGGLCLESDYSYKGEKGKCNKKCKKVSGTVPKSFTDVKANDEASMMAAVAKQPVSIAIEADQSGFQFYKSGVFTGKCGTQLDHGVLNVGYGTMDDKDYWKVKNSWGETWGQDGFILLGRGSSANADDNKSKAGQCGILKQGSYPNL